MMILRRNIFFCDFCVTYYLTEGTLFLTESREINYSYFYKKKSFFFCISPVYL